MRDFHCSNCGQQLSFENTVCLNCGRNLGFHLPSHTIQVLDDDEKGSVEGATIVRLSLIHI